MERDLSPGASGDSDLKIVEHDTVNATRIQEPPWFPRRKSSVVDGRRRSSSRRPSIPRRPSISKGPNDNRWWHFTIREWDDEQEPDWWFAGTAIPLLAATLGPLANVLSIAALVSSWRQCLVPDVTKLEAAVCYFNGNVTELVSDVQAVTFADPTWCYWANVASLIMGFVGNIFLLFNFTNRVRYIIALPVTIILWFLATGILIGITIAMETYVPPVRPQQDYTEGFWYAVIAAILYLVCSVLLLGNLLGYALGHYSATFNLTDSQRTLILQTMLFFIWLAGGAAVFSKVESTYGEDLFNWSYPNALYFCDVTILTVGFGDLYPSSNIGRGLVFPFSVGGIIMLGLMISSITKFAAEMGQEKVLQRHVERSRSRTVGRTVTNSMELRDRTQLAAGIRPTISGPFDAQDRSTALQFMDDKEKEKQQAHNPYLHGLRRVATMPFQPFVPNRKPRLILLREERDRFNTMRAIQHNTEKWKQWTSLSISVFAFAVLWCVGAVIFWVCERGEQGITYFESLYLCYVSLLTIGYGDLAPRSSAGRPFFVVWSLIAIPTMTILIADMGDTVIHNFNKGTFALADFTVLPKEGIWRGLLLRFPWLLSWLQSRKTRRAIKQRLERGFETGPEEEAGPTIDALALQEKRKPTDYELARKLGQAIRRVANDLKEDTPKTYSYEQWVEFTQLIRFTSSDGGEHEEEEEGLIEWDWIGEDSPMMAQESEPEFVLDRLCESMGRYIRRMAPATNEVERKVIEVGNDDLPNTIDDDDNEDNRGRAIKASLAQMQDGIDYAKDFQP